MTLRVAMIELNETKNMLPLASAYLRNYACLDPDISANVSFSLRSFSVQSSRDSLVRDFLDENADIYTFSCYVWNMRLVKFLANQLMALRPSSVVMLGGPQVDGHLTSYVQPSCQRIYVCNKEGEQSFRQFVRFQMGAVDVTEVPGVSFWRDGECVSNPPMQNIRDVNEIPSPFLSGILDQGQYSASIWETNRGCPYQCTFCYWGKGQDTSIRKFDSERLRAEIDWFGRKGIYYLHIGDANWGIFDRDLELTEELVKCHERYGTPAMVAYSSAKNRPDRASQIADVLYRGRIISSRPIGIQSTTKEVLKAVKRKNIDLKILTAAGANMQDKGISTYPELIWPLPGETFASFKTCLTDICNQNFASIVVFPALVLHSTEMEQQVDEFKIATVDADDENSELKVVVSTKDVTREEAVDGCWLSFGLHCLYNARTLRYTGGFLNSVGIVPWGELMWNFARHLRLSNAQAAQHWEEMVSKHTHAEYWSVGELIHRILHRDRNEYQHQLFDFACRQPWWKHAEARVLFEADLLSCPFIYSNTVFVLPQRDIPLHHFSYSVGQSRDADLVVEGDYASLIGRYVLGDPSIEGCAYHVEYQIQQYPYMPAKSLRDNYNYVYGAALRGGIFAPRWHPARDNGQRAERMVTTQRSESQI